MKPLSAKQLSLIISLRNKLGLRPLDKREVQLLNISSATVMIEDLIKLKSAQQ